MTEQLHLEPMEDGEEMEEMDLMNPDAAGGHKSSVQKVGEEKDLLGDGGVLKTLVQEGEGWEQPQKDDKVFVHYTGTLTDGTQFDSSVDRGVPLSFTAGHGQVIKGWDTTVLTMKKGEKCSVKLAPEYAYGAAGSLPAIPENATLCFDMQLLSWESLNDLSPEKDGSLMKTIIDEGDLDVWDKPKEADLVTVAVRGRVRGADAPFLDEPGVEFSLAAGWLCPAVGAAVVSMKKGERVLIKAGPRWAFGDEGREGVPAGADVELTIALLRVKTVKSIDPDHTGAVSKTILVDGAAYHTPNDYAAVTVSWTAALADGTQFDEMTSTELSMAADPFPCEALELAVASMRNGEQASVTAYDPTYAFGAAGVPNVVPPNAVVTYVLFLHDFKDGAANYELSDPDKAARAEDLKQRGNKFFKAGALRRARRLYDKAEHVTGMAEADGPAAAQLEEVKLSVAANMSAVCLKEGLPKECIINCNKVLEKRSTNVKALYRRSCARSELGDLAEAKRDLQAALELEPGSAELTGAMKKLRVRMKAADKKDSALYGAMFSKVGKMYSDVPAHSPSAPPDPAEPTYEGELAGGTGDPLADGSNGGGSDEMQAGADEGADADVDAAGPVSG